MTVEFGQVFVEFGLKRLTKSLAVSVFKTCIRLCIYNFTMGLVVDCIAGIPSISVEISPNYSVVILGVPAAMISIKAVPLLCRCLLLQNDQVHIYTHNTTQ